MESAVEIERAMERIEALGLNASVATEEDAELMYLQKQAYVLNIHKAPEWTGLLSKLDDRGASKPERVRELRAFWEQRLGVKDVTKLPGYDPLGEHQAAFKRRGGTAGYRHQYRFDLSDEDLEKRLPGYALQHSLTNGEKGRNQAGVQRLEAAGRARRMSSDARSHEAAGVRIGRPACAGGVRSDEEFPKG